MLINCDLGECLTPSPDGVIMPLIDMANIACGGHSGNDFSMIQSIKLALKNGVKIGAHPSYFDAINFGRSAQVLSDEDLFELIYQQTSALKILCEKNAAKLEYIKPHGALYHNMMANENVFKVFCKVISELDLELFLVMQFGFENNFQSENVRIFSEVFADRAYFPNSSKMLPRGEKGAVLDDAKAIIKQYNYFANAAKKADTICFHGDNPAAVEALRILKNA
ncbi:MAG: LamB/YcsF family protein [Candidatus Thioglobus sp.]|nr:LamB/YcsF family protein [Candidatus Thioglobus sp.]